MILVKSLNLDPFYDLTNVLIDGGHLLPIKQVGKSFLNAGSQSISNYHVPNLTSNRFSHQFCRKNSCAIDFNGSSMSLKD